MSQSAILSIENLSVSYGGIRALQGIGFEVVQGEIVALLGANGAGKSSALRAISGLTDYTGTISFQGKDLKGVGAHNRAALGITHVPEGRGIFGNLSVLENLKLATWQRSDKSELAKDFEDVFSLFPRLLERKEQLAETLSGGEQQMLALGRALMTKAPLFILDEPSMGLAPMLVREIFDVLKQINTLGTTILLVEQNANMALRIANRGYVLETGSMAFSGTTEALRGNDRIKAAYLGGA